MLTTKSITIATGLASSINSLNKKLIPKQNTLLNELTNSIKTGIYSKVDNEASIPPVIYDASLGKEVVNNDIKNYIQSDHDSIMDNYIDDLSKLVSSHLQFARNTVNNEVKMFKDDLETALSNHKYNEPEDIFNITYYTLPEVYKSTLIENEITPYGVGSTNHHVDTLNTGALTTEDLNVETYLLTGDESIDSYILNLIRITSPEKVLGYLTTSVMMYSLDLPELLNYSLFNYLFYRNLTEKLDLNMGLTTLQLRAKASNNRDYFGKSLHHAIDLYNKNIRQGVLLCASSDTKFSYFNNTKLDIMIYEDSFAMLAEKSVPIEALFGYISYTSDANITAYQLTAKSEMYVDKWNIIKNLYLVKLNNSKLDTFKQLVRFTFDKTLQNAPVGEVEGRGDNPTKFTDETMVLFDEYLDDIQLSEIDDLVKVSLCIVAKIRFRFSNAYYILNGMNELLLTSDSIKPEEAALYSCISYVCDYLIQQADIITMN